VLGRSGLGLWLLAGVIFGLSLWSKYTDAFLAPGVLLWLLADGRQRHWLKRWQPWVAGMLALLVFSPVIWWNAQHDWVSFWFQGQRTVTDGVAPSFISNISELLAGQMLFMGPLLVFSALAGVVGFLLNARREGWSGLALPVWTTLPALAYFLFHALHARVEANWLMPLWPAMTLIGAWLAVRLWRRLPRTVAALLVVQVILGLTLTAFVYVQILWQPFNFGEVDRTNETRGWPSLQQAVSAAAKANGAHWVATAGNFALTGELATYFAFAGDPLPIRQVDEPQRWDFLPPLDGDALGWPALFITTSPDAVTALFGQAKAVGTVDRDNAHGPIETYSLFVVSDPTSAFLTAEGK
jgi:4-amino-4-deoxy-L-arabinose transferase-like glycosyltransferase